MSRILQGLCCPKCDYPQLFVEGKEGWDWELACTSCGQRIYVGPDAVGIYRQLYVLLEGQRVGLTRY